ncbi:DUF4392 domain-containing protein [Bifidobacterium animalis]|uniref:D-glutamate cyclase-like C-terminal domain-containing protein n=1 Tax=Bifidobacterium animalis subsp. lactis TaxID=302911 RepID=A0A8B3RL83_BIFAN|nr:DUF4392 domain-containing protein [Bifidobacterium animalis]ANU43434.1 hypothetical protein A4U98_02355 [Bifidobacterium animalis subsp. animalis]PHQ54037.1 DUF4392 domain-containing protein [Bifidobacterium animalis subsp. animalis]QQQ89657.1 DUF4392 domain-containing protein [Bifidobacterium animalis]RYM97846.1 hypothetical protein PG2011B_0097 [Bifidobacterium animalis subsp. lactis]UQE63901.1 DUF4392 domain-containing protein [Bifidobacterium animalis]
MGSITDWSKYPRISRIANAAAADVRRGSETLMTYVRGDLFRAARHLALGTEQPRRARRENRRKTKRPARALVVTGFYIPQAQQPAAETDGPLGAIELCMALRAVGGDAWLVSDEHCAPVICAAAGDLLPEDRVLIAPHAKPEFDAWFNMVIDLVKRYSIDTLVFIERVGPARDGRPRNMRGVDIAEWTAPLSQLALLELHTIGVGDGGNEIGMGRVADYAISGVVAHGESIACTVAADQLVVAGTSNWGAHALVCAMRALGCPQVEPYLEPDWHRAVLNAIVVAGGLDGVHMTNVPTVDGLDPARYFGTVAQLSAFARS